MSSMQLPSFEETAFQSKMARMRRIGFIDGEKKGFNEGKKKGFNEGKKKGFDDGVKEGHADVVKNLLKHYDAFKVSEIAGLDLDFVWDVENNNY